MRATAAILFVLLLAACARFAPGAGGSASPTPGGGRPDVIGAWVMTTGTADGEPISVPDNYRVTLTFTDDDEVGGQACNHYGGTYDLRDDGTISFSAMSMTEMACEEPMMTVEAAYHAALAAVTRAERSGDVLTLSGDGAELVFELLPPVPDAALQNTRWSLESLISGDAVSSVIDGGWLKLNADGTLGGSTGCRDFDGSYVVTGDTVAITDLSTTDQACEADLEAQDRHVIEVIEGGFMVAIDGDRLTLTLVDGNGLDYRAVER
jgi:heat shock protein HslJ